MYPWIDGWVDGGWTDGRMDGWTDGRMYEWMDGRMDTVISKKACYSQ